MRLSRSSKHYDAIEPDEILIDAANLPAYDTARLEGKIERPFSEKTFTQFLLAVGLVSILFLGKLFTLQVVDYQPLAARAEENRLAQSLVLAERGLIVDRHGEILAENTTAPDGSYERTYPLKEAAAHVVGYVSYPKKDAQGNWFQETTEGVVGIESILNDALRGENGIEIAETDATGDVVSGSIVRKPVTGATVALSLDAGIQKALYDSIRERSRASNWQGGTGVLMDVQTGEILALASYPSFDPEVMSSGNPKEIVDGYLVSERSPFLDRAVSGVYTPGSVVKPFVALAALEEGIIVPEKEILSTGSISVPNPYDPSKPSVFRDWKAHGWVNMREAIAVSSDVYFYEIGGGFEGQRGLGITRIEEYMKKFGFGSVTGIALAGEEPGIIPNPEWKAAVFDGEPWVLGNTYHTAIGQYGFQATALQLVRAVAALANGAVLVDPVIEKNVRGRTVTLDVAEANLTVVTEGMRSAVTEGTAQALSVPGIRVAAKTGTAEIGARKEFTNSLIIGYFPYEKPRYAFALVMEKAKAGTLEGAPAALRPVLEWIVQNRPEMAE